MSKWTARWLLAGFLSLIGVAVYTFFQLILFVLTGVAGAILAAFGLKYLFDRAKE